MIILDSVNRSLEVKLPGAPATSQLTVVSSAVDISRADFSMIGLLASTILTNSGTAVTVLAAPAAGVSRQLKFLSIENTDTAGQIVTVQYNDSGTIRPILVQPLVTGQTLQYTDGMGFTIACQGGGLSLPVTVGQGGIGVATLAAHGVMVGEGINPVNVTTPGTAGQVLTSNGAAADPTFQAIPTATVPGGGTGVATLAAHGVVIGEGAAPVAVTTPGLAGQVLTSNGASADPTFQAASGGISIGVAAMRALLRS